MAKLKTRKTPCAAGLRLRDADNADCRTIEGTAIVFNRESEPLYSDSNMEIREIISPDAVTEEMLRASDILMTLYHDNSRILARCKNGSGSLAWRRDDEGVHFSFDAPDTEDGRTALALVRSGDIDGCSFAFIVDEDDRTAVTRTVEIRDKRRVITYTVNRIEQVRDFTLTPRPAYGDTEVEAKQRDAALSAEKALADEVKHREQERTNLYEIANRYK